MATAIVRPDDVRKRNRQRIVSTLRREGVMSRTDLASTTGLSAATVSAITSDLLSENLLRLEDALEAPAAGRGRPKVSLGLDPEAALVGAVVLQLNSVAVNIVDYRGHITCALRRDFDTLNASRDELRNALVGCMADAMARLGPRRDLLRRVAIGVQGATDVEGTTMLWSPITPHADLPIRDWFADAFGLPARLSNDCDVMARALNWRDPERYGSNFAAVLLSHGVGMGLFLRGGIINGTISSGTEFGHITHMPGGSMCRCGSRGCIEAYAGDDEIERRAAGISCDTPPPGLPHEPDVKAVADAARAGDRQALAAIEDAGKAIGYGLASLYALVDPFPVVLIGQGTIAFDLMQPALRAALAATMAGRRAPDITIDCIADAQPLMHEGCAINALLVLDSELARAESEFGDPT